MIRVEHNVATGEILEITLTQKEVTELEKVAADRAADIAKLQSKTEAKAVLLERLGITADEAALLLG
jgi:hypothetical protein